jgi:hypothetical protein
MLLTHLAFHLAFPRRRELSQVAGGLDRFDGDRREQEGGEEEESGFHGCSCRIHLIRQFRSLAVIAPNVSKGWKKPVRSLPTYWAVT